MSRILVEHDPSPMKLEVLGVEDWPIATRPVSSGPLEYNQTETMYIVEGSADLTADGQDPVSIAEGDLVTIMPGTRCHWTITLEIVCHYRTG